jgi:hypothetical protein
MSILTSLGFTQFSQPLLSNAHPGDHNLTVSHVTPFGARLDIEVLKTRGKVDEEGVVGESESKEMKYIRFKLNERTLPHPRCAERKDGLCEMEELIQILKDEEEKAMFDLACFGEYDAVPHGELRDGHPNV